LAGIYIHIPFCRQACHYCDFHFSTNLGYKEQMVCALLKEIGLQSQYLEGNEIETIYFGGGTPSLLSNIELGNILEKIQNNFHVNPNYELTLEANPDDLNDEKLKNLHNLGFNRLSIGIQSFSDDVLTYLNRAHSCKEALNCVVDARKAGFDNISIDLIYGIHKSGHKGWEKDLEIVGELMPEHISAYCLTIEPKTTFGAWMKTGKIQPVDDEYAAQQFEYLMHFLESKGYEQYEISNFCLPGKYSRHNTNYWKQENYLGIGPGAHSFNGFSRQFNISNNIKYLKSIEKEEVPAELDSLSTPDKINEYVMTSLRTRWGCDLKKILRDFDFDVYKQNNEYIDELIDKGFLYYNNNILYLSSKGKLLADKIASDLFVINI